MIKKLIRKIFILWDPEFTKLTLKERKQLEKAEREMKDDDFIPEDDFWR